MSKNNTGENNTGNWNTGYWNTGNWNTGDRNTGNWNTGYWNTGDRNTGNWNTGDRNTGYRNTGNRNTGYCNSTNRSSGIFCSEEPLIIIFNKCSGKKWSEIDHPHFNEFYLTKWIEFAKMTAVEKQENPSATTTEGYLKVYTYQEAWANFWQETDEINRQKFLNLPNFDAKIFKDITGIDVSINNQKQELLNKANELIQKAEELKKEAEKLS